MHETVVDNLCEKLCALAADYELHCSYNPIEHIKSRIKARDKIKQKLIRRGYEPTCENAWEHITDIGGVRVVCSFIDDIYRIADDIRGFGDVSVAAQKDYIKFPKENGYRSLHLLLKVPAANTGREYAIIEVQLRTVAMDFWASSEHRIFYQFHKNVPPHMFEELAACAELAADLDEKMQSIRRMAGPPEIPGDSHKKSRLTDKTEL